MKRRQASAQHRLQQNSTEDLKVSPKKDENTRTRSRRRILGAKSQPFSWDPNSFCSDSDSPVLNTDHNKPVTLLTPAVDLTGSDTEHPANLNLPSGTKDDVLFSADDEEEEKKKIMQLLQKLRNSSSDLEPVGKISLGPKSMAEDTLEEFRLNTSGQKLIPGGSYTENDEHVHSHVDNISSGDSVISGPSSPHSPPLSVRCRECERLFTKMRRQGHAKTKKRDNDPASLSCDQWWLNKTCRPQGWRQVKGRLWVHLKRIRKLALEHSTNATGTLCSRPHVFLQRNLRCCQQISSMFEHQPDRKARSSHRRRHKAKNAWPPLNAKRQKQNKSKLLEKSTLSENHSILHVKDTHYTSSQQQQVFKKQNLRNVSTFLINQSNCDGLEATRRVLKFDESLLSVKMQKPRLGLKNGCEKQNESQAEFTVQQKVMTEEEEFRTPDFSHVDSEKSRPSSSDQSPGVQNSSFRSMLAAFKKTHNRIIKESHH